MAISYYESNEGYILNHIRTKKINSGFLITTDFGSWVYLNDEEFRQLRTNKLKEPLLGFLKEKGIIVEESNISRITDKLRDKLEGSFQGGSFHVVYPSISGKKIMTKNGMSSNTAIKIADFILQSPSSDLSVRFQANDLQAEFGVIMNIIDYIKMKNGNMKNLKFNILADLTSMNNEILDLLIKENIGFYTYFDGCREVHEKNWGNYDQVVHWVKESTKKYKINCIAVVTKNSLDYHTEMIDGFASLGLDSFELKPFCNDILAFPRNISVSSDEFLEFWKKALDYLLAINKKNILAECSTKKILKSIMGMRSVDEKFDMHFNVAVSKLAYTCDGEVFYTDDEGSLHDIFRLGSVDDSYSDLLSSKTMEGIVRASLISNPIHETSAFGPYYNISPLNAFAENGNIIEKFPNKRYRVMEGMLSHVFEKLLFDEEFKNMFLKWMRE